MRMEIEPVSLQDLRNHLRHLVSSASQAILGRAPTFLQNSDRLNGRIRIILHDGGESP